MILYEFVAIFVVDCFLNRAIGFLNPMDDVM